MNVDLLKSAVYDPKYMVDFKIIMVEFQSFEKR